MPSSTILEAVTEEIVIEACEIAQRIVAEPRAHLADTVRLAIALLRFRDMASRQVIDGIRVGERLRVSVKLIGDLYEMPGHESVTVRLVRVERGADAVGVLVLQQDREAEQ